MLDRRQMPRALIALLILSAVLAVAVYLVRQRMIPVALPPVATKTGSDALTVERIKQTSTRNGRTEWSLEAASAEYLLSEKKMILKELAVTFFTEDGQPVQLSAHHGQVKTDSHDMEASEEVVIYNDIYRLETEQIQYVQADRMITSKTPVKITGPAGEIVAESMFVDLKSNRLVMEGNVRGTLVSAEAR